MYKWAHKLNKEADNTCLRNTVGSIQRHWREAKRLPAAWHSPECGLHLHSAHLHSLCWLITLHHPLSATRQSPFIHMDNCTIIQSREMCRHGLGNNERKCIYHLANVRVGECVCTYCESKQKVEFKSQVLEKNKTTLHLDWDKGFSLWSALTKAPPLFISCQLLFTVW